MFTIYFAIPTPFCDFRFVRLVLIFYVFIARVLKLRLYVDNLRQCPVAEPRAEDEPEKEVFIVIVHLFLQFSFLFMRT